MFTLADKYLVDDIQNIRLNGFRDTNPRPKYSDGTPAYTYSVNHNIRKYNLSQNEFPITTLRPIGWKGAIKEMLWIFQKKSNNLDMLRDEYNIHVWDQWESKDIPGTIGNRYGHTIEKYNLFEERVLKDIKNDPFGRYHICNMWQEEELQSSDGLKPCAYETIWNLRKGLRQNTNIYLDMMLIQRSGDMLVASGAGNWNEVQYASLMMMTAQCLGYKPGIFTHVVVNEQIYDRHMVQATELTNRYKPHLIDTIFSNDPKKAIMLYINPDIKDFYKFTIDDFEMKNYLPIKPQLKFDIGV